MFRFTVSLQYLARTVARPDLYTLLPPGERAIYERAAEIIIGRPLEGCAAAVQSNAWNEAAATETFQECVFTLPHCTLEPLEGRDRGNCEACGRSNHPASLQMTFQGRRYCQPFEFPKIAPYSSASCAATHLRADFPHVHIELGTSNTTCLLS